MQQEGAQLVSSSGVCNRKKARRTLLKVPSGSAAGHVATGAPLLNELAAFGGVRHRVLRSRGCKHQKEQHDSEKPVVHGFADIAISAGVSSRGAPPVTCRAAERPHSARFGAVRRAEDERPAIWRARRECPPKARSANASPPRADPLQVAPA